MLSKSLIISIPFDFSLTSYFSDTKWYYHWLKYITNVSILILTFLFLDSDKSRSHSYGVYLPLEGRSSVVVLLFYLFYASVVSYVAFFCHNSSLALLLSLPREGCTSCITKTRLFKYIENITSKN